MTVYDLARVIHDVHSLKFRVDADWFFSLHINQALGVIILLRTQQRSPFPSFIIKEIRDA